MNTINDEEKIMQIYRRLEPSRATIKFMEEIREETNNLKIQLTGMNKDIQYLCKQMEENNKDSRERMETISATNVEQHGEIISRIGRMEKFGLAVLVIFALATVYFIFGAVGLPH